MSKSNISDDTEFLKAINALPSEEESTKQEAPKTAEEELMETLNSSFIVNPPAEENIDDEKPVDTPEPKQPEAETQTENEAEVEREEQTSLKRFGVRDTIRSLVANDVWQDVGLKIGEKVYENIEDLLQNEKPTQELFDSLSEAQKSLRDKKLSEEYISIKDKDTTKVKLINAILSDVDYDDLLQYNKEIIQPVTRLDFSNQADQDVRNYTLGFVRQCLIELDGVPEKYADIELKDIDSNFRLIEKAEEFQARVIQNYETEIESRTAAKNAERQLLLEEKKTNMKVLKEELKKQGFNDSFSNKALQLRFSEDIDGELHYIKLIKDKIQNPDFQAKLLHFLLDENDFINKVKTPAKTEASKETLEIIQILPKDKGGKATPKKPSISLTEADEEFLDAITKR